MKINYYPEMELTEVYNPITFVSGDGEELTVCMRDGGYEIGVRNRYQSNAFRKHIIKNGEIEELSKGRIDE